MKHSRVYHFVWLLTFENEWIHYLPIEDELFTQLEGIMWWSSILYHKFIAPNSNRWPNNWWSNSFHETTLWVLPRGTIRDGLSLFIQKYCYIAPCMDYLPTFIQQNDTNVGDSTLRVSRPILEGWWYPQDLQRHSTPFWIWLNFHSPSHSPPKNSWLRHGKNILKNDQLFVIPIGKNLVFVTRVTMAGSPPVAARRWSPGTQKTSSPHRGSNPIEAPKDETIIPMASGFSLSLGSG